MGTGLDPKKCISNCAAPALVMSRDLAVTILFFIFRPGSVTFEQEPHPHVGTRSNPAVT